jgi:hypothetical protein
MPLSGFISVAYFASRRAMTAIQDGVSASIRNLAIREWRNDSKVACTLSDLFQNFGFPE